MLCMRSQAAVSDSLGWGLPLLGCRAVPLQADSPQPLNVRRIGMLSAVAAGAAEAVIAGFFGNGLRGLSGAS
jgi:hypothetical protein